MRIVKPLVLVISSISLLLSCQTLPDNSATTDPQSSVTHSSHEANQLLIIDCLLPGQLRKLGTDMTYMTPRRPIRTSAKDCEIRGGEYVAYDRADYRTALKVWLESAKQGDTEAQVNVGEIFEKGLGTEPNYVIAAEWYRKAALNGNTRGAVNLGYLYEKGLGVVKNPVEALNWYRKASGLDTDELQYASTLEAQSQEKIGKISQQLEQSKKETTELRKKLRDNQHALRQKQSALAQYERDFSKNPPNNTNQRVVELEKRRQQIQELKTAASSFQKKLDTLEKNSLAEQGPVIELLDPPLALTRGIPSVHLRSGIKERIIVGKVIPPHEIASLKINGVAEHLDAFGIFQTPIPIKPAVTPVSVVAVDKNGQRAVINFQLIPSASVESMTAAKLPDTQKSSPLTNASGIDFGHYYALIIGNNRYTNFPHLESAINDAKMVDNVLKEKYGFKTKLLLNADRYSILSALSELRVKLTDKDNLLIYYAGHGELDSDNERGHWLPVDAEFNNPANWISNTDITDIINTIAANHILVVADSCYSGALTRSSLARLAPDLPDNLRMKWYKVMAASKSRTALTSGGLEPVLDSGTGHHSIFAKAFLDALQNNRTILEAYGIFRDVSINVMKNAAKLGITQTPQYAPIKHSGHEAGEFLFVPKSLQSS